MTGLDVFLFGSPHLERDGVRLAVDRRKALALLAYLAFAPGPHTRDALAELFWPERDEQTARTDLRSAVFSLQQAIGHEWLALEGDAVALRRTPDLHIDAERFRSLIERASQHRHPSSDWCAGCAAALAEAAQLYRGDFMAGFALRDAPEFDTWQTYQTESLRLALIGALERLAQLEAARGDYEAAIGTARRWLEQDPLCEEPHRALMQLHARAGNRAAALRQYDECVRVLDEELGIPPDPETTDLRDAIAGSAIQAHPQIVARPPPLELPPDRTPFIGREAELAQVAERFADPGCRLLTVLGPGGSGKTRLAIQAARAQAGSYADGIFFVDLQPVGAPDLLAPAILRALAVPASGADAADQLVAYLRDREALLLLDNFEHLMEGVGLLPRLLEAAPGVRLLVTARARLNLVQEWLLPLEGLELPPLEEERADLSAYDATALFLACAARLRPGYRPSQREAADVTRICRSLSGMPLGIELAAARTRTLPVAEIAAELARGLDVLATTLRDLPERHRSMVAAFDGSWRLLTPHEQSILRCASVFRGGFTREAAAAVTGATPADLEGLVDTCWLRVEPGGRYGMHELIRQYCAEKLQSDHLAQAGEDARQVHDRHSAYYQGYIAGLKKTFNRNVGSFEVARPEFDNLIAMWEWMLEEQAYPALRRCLMPLELIMDHAGVLHIVQASIQQAIEKLSDPSSAEDKDQRDQRLVLLAVLWFCRADVKLRANRLEDVEACVEHCDSLLAEADPKADGWVPADFFRRRMRFCVAYFQGDIETSKQIGHGMLADVKRPDLTQWADVFLGPEVWRVDTSRHIGHCELAMGHARDALAWAERSLAYAVEANSEWSRAYPLGLKASALDALGEHRLSEQAAQESLQIAQRAGDQVMVAWALWCLSEAKTYRTEYAAAGELARHGIHLCERIGLDEHRLPLLQSLAKAELALGNVIAARQHLEESLSRLLDQQNLYHSDVLICLLRLAEIEMQTNDPARARERLRTILRSPARMAYETAEAIRLSGELLRREGLVERAATILACVANAPTAWQPTRVAARRALEETAHALSPDPFAAAVARGEARPLDDVIAEILSEAGRPNPTPPIATQGSS